MLFKRNAALLLSQTPTRPPPCYDDCLTVDSSVLSPLSHDFDALVWNKLDHFKVPGLAVAVVHGGETYAKGYGIAEHPNTEVTPDTIFYGSSTTKAFVAAALSLLIDESQNYSNVQWTTPISELIRDDFVLEEEYATNHVTLEDAASHRTGLPRHDLSLKGGNQTVRDVVRSMRYLPMTKPIRTTYQYCNLMYATLGYIIETLTGSWLGDFLAARIWKPLEMDSTYFSLSDALNSGKPVARGHYWLRSKKKFIEVDYSDPSSVEGAGAILSSVLDYSKWIRMILNRSGPISNAGYEALLSPHMIQERDPILDTLVTYGFGWDIMQYRGYEIFTHGGSDDGFGSNVLFIPAMNWGCVMMSNIEMYSNVVEEILTWHLVDELLDTPKSSRLNITKYYDDALAELPKAFNATWAREYLYPSDKLANISTSLPLPKYAGTYSHPGYGSFRIHYENHTLWNRLDRRPVRSWVARLDHLTGDRFFVIAYDDASPEDPFYSEAEFTIDWQGKVEKLGVTLDDEMGLDKIWFDKVT